MKSCFGYSELEKLLEGYGFLIYEFLNPEEIQSRFFNSSDGEMTAFECINYVRAVLKNNFDTECGVKQKILKFSKKR